jgi:hypothetical protein
MDMNHKEGKLSRQRQILATKNDLLWWVSIFQHLLCRELPYVVAAGRVVYGSIFCTSVPRMRRKESETSPNDPKM